VRRPCAHRELLLLVEDLEHVVCVGLADLAQLVGAVEPPVVLELGRALGRADLKLGTREPQSSVGGGDSSLGRDTRYAPRHHEGRSDRTSGKTRS
jgi:hypothetical protein